MVLNIRQWRTREKLLLLIGSLSFLTTAVGLAIVYGGYWIILSIQHLISPAEPAPLAVDFKALQDTNTGDDVFDSYFVLPATGKTSSHSGLSPDRTTSLSRRHRASHRSLSSQSSITPNECIASSIVSEFCDSIQCPSDWEHKRSQFCPLSRVCSVESEPTLVEEPESYVDELPEHLKRIDWPASAGPHWENRRAESTLLPIDGHHRRHSFHVHHPEGKGSKNSLLSKEEWMAQKRSPPHFRKFALLRRMIHKKSL